MARKRITSEKLARIEGSTRVIRGINRLLCICVAIAFGLLVASTAIPQKREYEKLQAKLRMIKEREENTVAIKEHREIELKALREDTAYLEIQARDRLNYYRPGERVLRFDPNR